jgi:hypothetical protein
MMGRVGDERGEGQGQQQQQRRPFCCCNCPGRYPNLWRMNLYGRRGNGLAPSLGSSPGEYASLFGNLPAAGDGLYQGGGGSGNRLQDGHQAFAAAMNTMLRGLLCYKTINIKERR